jgi:hypothetical protein
MVRSDREEAAVSLNPTPDQKAMAWIKRYAAERGLSLENLSTPQWFALSSKVPCPIRCWRVGIAISVTPGQECPECGKTYETTLWARLSEEDSIE